MKALKPLLFLCAALCFATSCNKEADMTLVQKTVLENNTLSQIHIDDAWEVNIVYDSLNSFVELEYSAYLEDFILVREINNWLEIGFNQKVYPLAGSVYKATVHTMEKEHLNIRAENECVITLKGPFALTEVIDMELINASTCSEFTVAAPSCSILVTKDSQLLNAIFTGTNCSVLATKNSSCKGIFNVEQSFNAGAKISSQVIVFGGSIPSATLEAGDEGTINMAQVEVEEMNVHLAGASEATVNVTETLSGFLLEGSTLYYKGHPQIDVDCSDDSQLIPF